MFDPSSTSNTTISGLQSLFVYLSLGSFLWCRPTSRKHSDHPLTTESCCHIGPPPCLQLRRWYPSLSRIFPHSQCDSQPPNGIGQPIRNRAAKRNSLGLSASFSEEGTASSHEPLPFLELIFKQALSLASPAVSRHISTLLEKTWAECVCLSVCLSILSV